MPWKALGPYFLDENKFPRAAGLGQQVLGNFAKPFLDVFFLPRRARDEMLRGRFNKAVPELVELRRLAREAEERFGLLVEGTPDYAMFLLDRDNRITYWSSGAEKVFSVARHSSMSIVGASNSNSPNSTARLPV